jgi:hypothetical protein
MESMIQPEVPTGSPEEKVREPLGLRLFRKSLAAAVLEERAQLTVLTWSK